MTDDERTIAARNDARWNAALDLWEANDAAGALASADALRKDYPDVDDCAMRVAFFIREGKNEARMVEAESAMRSLVQKQPENIIYSQLLYHILFDQNRLRDALDVVERSLATIDSDLLRKLRENLIAYLRITVRPR